MPKRSRFSSIAIFRNLKFDPQLITKQCWENTVKMVDSISLRKCEEQVCLVNLFTVQVDIENNKFLTNKTPRNTLSSNMLLK